MTLSLGLSFLLSLGAGLLLVLLAWPERSFTGSNGLLRLALAIGLGMASLAEIYFLWLLTSAAPSRLVIAELVILVALAGAVLYRRSRPASHKVRSTIPPSEDVPSLRRFLTIAVVLAIVPAAWAFVSALQNQPHGGWDAWM